MDAKGSKEPRAYETVEAFLNNHRDAADHLEEITHRKHAAIFRAQREKAMDGSFHVSHGYGLRGRTRLQGTDK